MDYITIIVAIVSGILGIGAVSLFITSHIKSFAKYVMIAKDATETLSDVANSLKPDADGKVSITQEEVAEIQLDVEKFKADLKA